MTRKQASVPSALPEHGTPPAPPATAPHQEHGTPPAPHATEPHHDVSSPAVVHANDRMKLSAQPNDGEPLSHRDRGKAGRKG